MPEWKFEIANIPTTIHQTIIKQSPLFPNFMKRSIESENKFFKFGGVSPMSLPIPDVPTMKLELIPVPVSDIDQAIEFYVEKVGFELDHDVRPFEENRIVQLTPPGSACSILLSAGLPEISDMVPGSLKALHLVVDNIAQARHFLVNNGVGCSDIDDMGGVLYVSFSDPDGNMWLLQEITFEDED